MPKRNFVIVSGGPGIYYPCDPKHDQSWSNFVDNILLLASKGRLPKKRDEEVWWFVYKPAFVARWSDDVRKRRSSVRKIRGKRSRSYWHHLERRARQRGLKLRALSKASDFWKKLKTFKDPISRIWYFGHAKYDLWLSLDHNSSCGPTRPAWSKVIRRTDIASQKRLLKRKFQAGGRTYRADRSCRFYGCNTYPFAKAFAKAFGVYAEGARGDLVFRNVHSQGGSLRSLQRTATWIKYKPNGSTV